MYTLMILGGIKFLRGKCSRQKGEGAYNELWENNKNNELSQSSPPIQDMSSLEMEKLRHQLLQK